jgi:hypothetical protein
MNSLDKQLFKQIQLFGYYRWILTPDNPDNGDTLVWDAATETWIAEPPADTSNFIEKPSGSVSGDFLRYNGTSWVAAGADQSYLAIFSAFNDTATVTVNTAGSATADIVYDTEDEKDTDFYSHTVSAAGVTVLQSGLYFVQADIGVSVTAVSGVGYIETYLAKNGTEIAGTKAFIDCRVAGSRASGSIGKLLSLTANDVIKQVITAISTTSLNASTLADTCRMTITTLATVEADIPADTGPAFIFSSAGNSMYLSLV